MRLIIAVLSILLLTGCETVRYIDRPVPYLREPLGMNPPQPEQMETVRVILFKPDGQPAFFKMTPHTYKRMILNNKRVENYIREANRRIEACEAYYTAPIEEDNKNNKQ